MPNQGSVRVRRRLMKICIAFFSVVLSLVLVEVAFRFMLYRDDLKTSHAFNNIGNIDSLKQSTIEVTLREMIHQSDNPRIIYELIPDISVFFMGKKLTINSHGFRGPQYSTIKSNKAIRIVGLGDSLMFGWGVSDDEYYLSLLSQYLNQSSTNGYRWEVINTAVSGYNTVMEVGTLKSKGLKYSPDLVIVDCVMNDLDLPNFIRKEENYLSLQRSFAVEYFLPRLTQNHTNSHDLLIDAPLNTSRSSFESDPSRVPVQYRDMVGLDAYRSAMSELKALSLKHHFQILIFSTYFQKAMKEVLVDLDLPLLEAGDAITLFMAQHGFKEYVGSPLSVGKQDPHPSSLGHSILAEVLYKYLTDSGVVSRIYRQRGIMNPSE
jgi:hypothetical protein